MTDWAEAAYGDLADRSHGDRPYVVVNMVASLDGAISVDGRTSKLGGASDGHLFHYLRSVADVILVGAQTVRAENYGPPRVRDQWVESRAERGQEPQPRLAIVTRSLDLDWDSRLFGDGHRPIVVIPASVDPERAAKAIDHAEVIVAGDRSVDVAGALEGLRATAGSLILCEGGPTLNGELARDDLIDELCITIAPELVGGDRVGLLRATLLEPLHMDAVSVLQREGDLFLRYRREGH